MPARAYAVHRLPGRVRLKIPSRRSDEAFFAEVERRLRRLEGVTRVHANAVTGSVLVEHKGEIADLAREALGSDLGELVDIALGLPPVARRLNAEAQAIDTTVRRWSGGAVDLGTVASLALLAMAAIHLLRGRQPANAVSLGWYATELLRRSSAASEAS